MMMMMMMLKNLPADCEWCFTKYDVTPSNVEVIYHDDVNFGEEFAVGVIYTVF